jgi:hypothetical protein
MVGTEFFHQQGEIQSSWTTTNADNVHGAEKVKFQYLKSKVNASCKQLYFFQDKPVSLGAVKECAVTIRSKASLSWKAFQGEINVNNAG